MEVLCDKYQIYRRDRGGGRNGGGVLIAVSSRFSSELLPSDSSLDIEFISIKIKLKNKHMFVTCSYIPPNSVPAVYDNHLRAVKNVVLAANSTDSDFVFGDFNLPDISWNYPPDTPNLVPLKSNDFLNDLADLCLFQMNGVYNVNGKLLDLVFVNEPNDCTITRSSPVTNPEDRHHPTIEISCPFPIVREPKTLHKREKVFCFKQCNYQKLNILIRNTNWHELLSITNSCPFDIDLMTEKFYKTIYSIMDKCIPKFTVHKHSGPPWSSKQLSKLKNKKNKLYKTYKQSKKLIDYGKYSICRAKYNSLNTALYNNYINNMKMNFRQNPKSFYKFVNSKRRSHEFPSVMKLQNCESDDDVVISNMFADFFATTYSDAQYDFSSSYPFKLDSNHTISFPLIDHADVARSLKRLKFSFNHGPDGVPNCLLINCAESLSAPLSLMFNTSIKYGYFPKYWRSSYIIPLFKSGRKSDVKNYRGIAKLSSIPKLFEKFISDYLSHHVSSLMSPSQHGFRKGCSTTTNLLHLTTLINRGFVNGQQTDAVYTDFSKAFDKVNHNLLLNKLNLLGFTPNSLNWLKSYLFDRKQNVRYKNNSSKNINVISGVPQGSHLGPILFCLFINDLPNVVKFCNILMYADDVKIFLTYDEKSDHIYLQKDLDNFYTWCNINLMELNMNKCKYMRFSRRNFTAVNYSLGGHQLEQVDVFLDLGILLDAKLSFTSHINMMVNKARGVLAFIKRWAKEFTDPYITKQLYTSLVRPILEYGSIIWDPQYNIHIDHIESIQKQFLLFCLRSLPWNPAANLPSYPSRLALIKLPTLESRRTMLNVSFLLNLIYGDVCSEFILRNISFNVPQRPTRYYQPLSIPYFRTNYANADPLRRICNNFNDLYQYIDFSLNVNVIKSNIILFLNS